MSEEVGKINSDMRKGAVWMVAFKFFERSLGLISTIILARLLTPADFGLVAIAMVVLALMDLLRSFNFDIALIKDQDVTDEHFNTAWTFNVIVSLIISIVIAIGAPYVSEYYNDERLTNVLRVMAIYVCFSGFENIGVVYFRKELTFHKEFFYLISKKIIGFVTAISLAIYFRNYWALVGGTLAGQIGVVILSYYAHHYRPKLCIAKYKEMIGFSMWLLINNFLHFIDEKVPQLLIGKIMGTHSLGIYNVAYEISNMPTTELVAPINRAVLPGYSKLNKNMAALGDSYLKTLAMITMIAIPASVGMAAIAKIMVPVVLGHKWLDAVQIMQVLAFTGVVYAISSNAGALFLALGRPRIISFMLLVRVCILVPLLYYLTEHHGLLGSSYAVLIALCCVNPLTSVIALKILKLSIWDLVKHLYRPILSSIAMYFAVILFIYNFAATSSLIENITSLIISILIGAFVYVSCVILLWVIAGKPSGAEKFMLDKIKIFKAKLFSSNRLS